MCPMHCKVHLRVDRSTRLIESTISKLSLGSVPWILEVLCSLYWHIFNQIDHITLLWTVVKLYCYRCVSSAARNCFGPIIIPPVHHFSILENKLPGYADDSILMAVVPSPGVRVTLADSMICDLGRVSEWCNIWGTKFNASKIKTMIMFRSRTMHPQSPPLTIGGTGLKE